MESAKKERKRAERGKCWCNASGETTEANVLLGQAGPLARTHARARTQARTHTCTHVRERARSHDASTFPSSAVISAVPRTNAYTATIQSAARIERQKRHAVRVRYPMSRGHASCYGPGGENSRKHRATGALEYFGGLMNLAAVRRTRVTGEERRRTKDGDNGTDKDGKTSEPLGRRGKKQRKVGEGDITTRRGKKSMRKRGRGAGVTGGKKGTEEVKADR